MGLGPLQAAPSNFPPITNHHHLHFPTSSVKNLLFLLLPPHPSSLSLSPPQPQHPTDRPPQIHRLPSRIAGPLIASSEYLNQVNSLLLFPSPLRFRRDASYLKLSRDTQAARMDTRLSSGEGLETQQRAGFGGSLAVGFCCCCCCYCYRSMPFA